MGLPEVERRVRHAISKVPRKAPSLGELRGALSRRLQSPLYNEIQRVAGARQPVARARQPAAGARQPAAGARQPAAGVWQPAARVLKVS